MRKLLKRVVTIGIHTLSEEILADLAQKFLLANFDFFLTRQN